MRRRYKRCYKLGLRYEAPGPNAMRPKGGVSDPAIEKFVNYLINTVGLSSQYFDVIRWKTKDSSTQQVQWYQSDMCKFYVCDYAFFDAPAIIDHYDIASDEYNFFIHDIGYVVKATQWRINQRSYSNIVGKKPFNLSLDTIPESPVKVDLPSNPTKWSDLAINSDLKFIPFYLDTGAMLSAMYGANRTKVVSSSNRQTNNSSFGWLDLAFKPDPVLENTANEFDEAKLAAALQMNDNNVPDDGKEEFKAPPTPTAIHKSSEARKNRYYQNRDEYGYVSLPPDKPFSHQPSTPSRTNIDPGRTPAIQARGSSAGGRRPAIDKSGYITADPNNKFDPYNQAHYDYSDESDETVYSQAPSRRAQTPSLPKKTNNTKTQPDIQYLTDGADVSQQPQPIFLPFAADHSSKSGDDPTPLRVIQTTAPQYTEQVIRAARDLCKLWIVDEERMEKYLLKTECPARYFCNPLLIWIELPMDILKKKRCILNAGDKGRERLTSRINDRKYRRRAKGKSYYNTTLPSGWSMHVHNIPDFTPMDRWDSRYAHMLMRREQVLIKLRETERNNYLRGAQPTTDNSDKSKEASTAPPSKGASNSNTAKSAVPSDAKNQTTSIVTDDNQPPQQESSDDDDEVTEMENVD